MSAQSTTSSATLKFAGKMALITGAAGDIGAAVAQRLASDGARVVLADKNREGVVKVAAALVDSGLSAVAVECDQTSSEQVESLFREHLSGGLDICFANAGWGRPDAFIDMPLDTLRRTFDINVFGTVMVCQAAARAMVAGKRGGSIILTSSTGAQQAAALFGAYCAAKASLNMLARVMALELGAHDIRVNAVMPGVTATAMTSSLLKTAAKDLCEFEAPLGRIGRPEDIAGAVAFLAGDDSGYMTGTSLLVDGGSTQNATQWFSTDYRKRGRVDWKLRSECVVL
jgi:NAD(P)-dependent dehydrogenase (short-subunit alcohol dehydrogenase family)